MFQKKKEKPTKSLDPFYKAKKEWETKKDTQVEEWRAKKELNKQRARKMKKRKQETQAIRKKTKRGQPLMKNLMTNTLAKIIKTIE